MRFSPRFFFEANAGEDTTGGQPAVDPVVTDPAPAPAAFLSLDQAKELGIASLDELKQLLADKKANSVTDDQRRSEENKERADFLKFAADQNLLTVDEATNLTTVKAKADRDLVFENFSKEFLEEEKEATPQEIQAAFDEKFNLSDPRPGAKKWAEKQLSKEAAALRSPLESKFNTAKDQYETAKAVKQKAPEFFKFIETLVKESTPDKLVLHKAKEGEEEVSIDFDLTDKERKEIAEVFRTDKNFAKYFDGESKVEDLKAAMTKKINSYLKVKYFDDAVSKGYELGKGIGTKKGSNVGAETPFAIVKKDTPETGSAKVLSLDESNKKIAEQRQKYSNNR